MGQSFILDKRELQVLLWGILCLALLNFFNNILGMPYWTITQFIHLGLDDNISAGYSSMLFVVAALFSWECFVVGKRKDLSDSGKFVIFAALMLILSCDEISRIHETIGDLANKYTGVMNHELVKHSSWVWIGAPIVLSVFWAAFFLLKKLLSLTPKSLLYFGLGFGLIILGGVILESTINLLNHNELQWVWDIEIIVEESLEMIGTLSIAYALLLWRNGQVPKNLTWDAT